MSGRVIDVKAEPMRQLPQRSRLGEIKRGVIRAPKRYMLYGADGTGKTTLAANAPDPIFLDIEGGSNDVEVARYPFHDGTEGHVPQNFSQVLDAIADLTAAPHSYRTLVIDTADSLESLLWSWMIARDNDPSVMKRENPLNQIEDYGYGKGFNRAIDVWRDLCVKLDRLRSARSMEIVLLAHAQIKNFKNPEGADYDRWIPAMNEKASGFLKGWCDIVGRVCHEETTTEKKSKFDKVKGLSTGTRLIRLAHSAAFDAKGRGNLPDEIVIPIEAPWAPLAEAIDAGYEDDTKKLAAEIAIEAQRIGDAELTARVDAAAREATAKKDTKTLISYLNNLKARPAKVADSAQP